MKYQRFTPLSCKDIGIRKLWFYRSKSLILCVALNMNILELLALVLRSNWQNSHQFWRETLKSVPWNLLLITILGIYYSGLYNSGLKIFNNSFMFSWNRNAQVTLVEKPQIEIKLVFYKIVSIAISNYCLICTKI